MQQDDPGSEAQLAAEREQRGPFLALQAGQERHPVLQTDVLRSVRRRCHQAEPPFVCGGRIKVLTAERVKGAIRPTRDIGHGSAADRAGQRLRTAREPVRRGS
ncbi:hypothetical protein GCM10010297_61240 [Streptomyces malachitofuscus]|nr:hypothetical protein GCM10010297_61240 [Streptomyces malachitofuscus]